MDAKEKVFVDELLDASLRHLSDGEPRAGLEGRVLASVRARLYAERRRKVWSWALGMAGAVALTMVLLISRPHRQEAPMPVVAKTPATVLSPTMAKNVPPMDHPIPHSLAHHLASSRVDTRPQQFPTPRPLSEQERLLLVYVQSLKNSPGASAPDADRNSEGSLEIPPIRIAAIKINPLPSSEGWDKE